MIQLENGINFKDVKKNMFQSMKTTYVMGKFQPQIIRMLTER